MLCLRCFSKILLLKKVQDDSTFAAAGTSSHEQDRQKIARATDVDGTIGSPVQHRGMDVCPTVSAPGIRQSVLPEASGDPDDWLGGIREEEVPAGPYPERNQTAALRGRSTSRQAYMTRSGGRDPHGSDGSPSSSSSDRDGRDARGGNDHPFR